MLAQHNINNEQIESKKIRKTVANSDNYLVENGFEKEPLIKYSLNKKMTKEEEKPVFVEREGQEQRAQDPAIEILTDFSILYKDENNKEVDLENPLVIYNEVDYTSDSATDSALIPLIEDKTAREISDSNHFNKTIGCPCESINKAYNNNPEVPQMPKYLNSHSCNNNLHNEKVKRLKYRSKTEVSVIISSEPNRCLSSTIVTSGSVAKSASKLQYDRDINIAPVQPFKNADDVDIITNFEHYNKIEQFLKIYGNDSCNITASDIDNDKDFYEADKYSNTGTYGGSFEESYDYSFEYHSNYNSDGSFECYSFIYESSNHDDDNIYDIYSLTDKSPKIEDDSIMLAFKDLKHSNDLVSSSNVGLHSGHEKANELNKSNKVQEILKSNIALGNIFKPAVSQNKVNENGKNMFYLDSSKKYNEENCDNLDENINNTDDNNKENNEIYTTSSNPKDSSPMISKSNNENISEHITSDIKQLAVDKLHKLLTLNNSENYAISDSQELKFQCNLITDTYFKEISTSIIKTIGIDHIDDEGKKWIVNDLNSINKSVFKINEIFSELEELLNNDEKEKLQIPSLFEAYSNRFKILFFQIESDLEDICYQMALIDAHIY